MVAEMLLKKKLAFNSSFYFASFVNFKTLILLSDSVNLIEISRRFRKDIKEASNIEKDSEILSLFHCIWHLCEIIYLPSQGTLFSRRYVEWFNENYQLNIHDLLKEFSEAMNPIDDVRFWPLMKKLAIRGCINILNEFINIPVVQNIFSSMPDSEHINSSNEFLNSWKHWQDEVEFLLNHELQGLCRSDEYDHIRDILLILSGDSATILKVSDSWKEQLSGILFFKEPAKNAVMALSEITMSSNNLYDEILMSLLESDLPKFFAKSSQVDWWLVTHLFEVLLVSRNVDDDIPINELGDHFKTQLAMELSQDEDVWPLALEYISLTENGNEKMRQLVQTFPVNLSTYKSILDICTTHSFSTEAKQIHRVIAREWIKRDKLGSALVHYIKAQETESIDNLVEKILLEDRSECFADILDFVGEPFCDGLCLLEYFICLNGSTVDTETLSLIIEILSSHLAPKSLWPKLVQQGISLIEKKTPCTTLQVCELLRCLDEVDSTCLMPRLKLLNALASSFLNVE